MEVISQSSGIVEEQIGFSPDDEFDEKQLWEKTHSATSN